MTEQSNSLDGYISALRGVFAGNRDKYAAHAKARAVLQELAASPAAFTAMLERHIARQGSLDLRHYPVVSLEIDTNAHFGLVANCWIPLPDGATNVSTKAI